MALQTYGHFTSLLLWFLWLHLWTLRRQKYSLTSFLLHTLYFWCRLKAYSTCKYPQNFCFSCLRHLHGFLLANISFKIHITAICSDTLEVCQYILGTPLTSLPFGPAISHRRAPLLPPPHQLAAHNLRHIDHVSFICAFLSCLLFSLPSF